MKGDNNTILHLSPALWKIILIASMPSFCALLPADVIPALAQLFNIASNQAEGILSWFLLGYGLGPLIYGPISNRIGRKKALFIGLLISLIGMILSLLSLSVEYLPLMLLGRFIAGVGTSSGLIIGMVILNETNTPNDARKKWSVIMLFFAFAPAIAMAIGAILAEHINTTSVIVIMPLMTLGLIGITLTLKETYQGQAIAINIPKLARSYANALCSTPFIYLALILTSASAAMYVFNGISPLIAINTLNIAPELYGELAITSSFGLFFGALLSAQLAHRLSAKQNILIAVSVALLGSTIMLIAFLCDIINLYTLLAPAFLIFFGAAIIVPNSSMDALQHAKDPAIGASVMNATALTLGSIILGATTLWYSVTLFALPLSLVILAILGFIFLKLSASRNHN